MTRWKSKIFQITTIAAALLVAGFVAGMLFEGHYGDPVTLRLKMEIPPAIQTAAIYFGDNPPPIMIVGMYVRYIGNLVPFPIPRCRNVPEDAGCIDWLASGETWDAVLSHRPPIVRARVKPEWWERVVSAFETGRWPR